MGIHVVWLETYYGLWDIDRRLVVPAGARVGITLGRRLHRPEWPSKGWLWARLGRLGVRRRLRVCGLWFRVRRLRQRVRLIIWCSNIVVGRILYSYGVRQQGGPLFVWCLKKKKKSVHTTSTTLKSTSTSVSSHSSSMLTGESLKLDRL